MFHFVKNLLLVWGLLLGLNAHADATITVVSTEPAPPTLADAAGFTNRLQAANPPENIRTQADGAIVISYKKVIYSLRPNRLASEADSSVLSGQFTVGADKLLRFGNQTLTPAPYNLEQLRSMVTELDSSASLSYRDDGKLLLVFQGASYALTPDYQVVIPFEFPNRPTRLEMQNGKLIANYLFGFSQGFHIAPVGQ
jgi:hypothetical protein